MEDTSKPTLQGSPVKEPILRTIFCLMCLHLGYAKPVNVARMFYTPGSGCHTRVQFLSDPGRNRIHIVRVAALSDRKYGEDAIAERQGGDWKGVFD